MVRFYSGNQKLNRNWIRPASAVVVCRAYAIRPYPTGQKFIGVLVRFYPMNQKSDRNWIHSASGVAVCGAYAIRPYTVDLKNGDFPIHSTTSVAVCGAYAVAPYTGDLKNGDFSIRSASGVAVCRAYAIRPYPTGKKFIRILVRFYPMNQKSDRDWIHSATGVAVCGAYAIRPYTGIQKNGVFSIRSATDVAACRAYAIRPYPTGQKFIGVLVRFYPGKGKMAGDSMDRHPRKGVWGCSIVVVRFLAHMPGLHFEVTVDYIDG